MYVLLNRLCIALLTGALVLTAQGMAVARVTPGPTGQILLCIGADIVLVSVDAEGQPVDAPHICPDCILSFADLGVAASPLVPEGYHAKLQDCVSRPSLAACKSPAGFWSRAPPGVT